MACCGTGRAIRGPPRTARACCGTTRERGSECPRSRPATASSCPCSRIARGGCGSARPPAWRGARAGERGRQPVSFPSPRPSPRSGRARRGRRPRSVVAGVFRCARGASRFPSRSATAAAACLKWRFKRLRRMAPATSGCAGGATGCSAGSPGNSRGFRCRGWPPTPPSNHWPADATAASGSALKAPVWSAFGRASALPSARNKGCRPRSWSRWSKTTRVICGWGDRRVWCG